MRFTLISVFILLLPGLAFGKNVLLAWDASPSDSVTGYSVCYHPSNTAPEGPFSGTDAEQGVSCVDAGNVLQFELTGLIDSKDYIFAVVAYNSQGMESDYSNMVVSPAEIPGLEPASSVAGSSKKVVTKTTTQETTTITTPLINVVP